MRLKIKVNPGTNDFPELKSNLPQIGDVREFDQAVAERLLSMGLADVIPRETVRAIPKEPSIGPAKK